VASWKERGRRDLTIVAAELVTELLPRPSVDVIAFDAGPANMLLDGIVRRSSGGKLAFDDDSSPEAIRQKFGVSKKAFKQALGKLYKARRIGFLKPGIQLLENSAWSPGN